jgi:hypothetical protein
MHMPMHACHVKTARVRTDRVSDASDAQFKWTSSVRLAGRVLVTCPDTHCGCGNIAYEHQMTSRFIAIQDIHDCDKRLDPGYESSATTTDEMVQMLVWQGSE